jgi:hypothetical protein
LPLLYVKESCTLVGWGLIVLLTTRRVYSSVHATDVGVTLVDPWRMTKSVVAGVDVWSIRTGKVSQHRTFVKM